MRPNRRAQIFFCLVLSLELAGSPVPCSAWGNEGHTWINQVAAEKIPPDMPRFLRMAEARIAYLGPEPDRWRDPREAALNAAQAPEHYIDLERVAWMRQFPPDRMSFLRMLSDRRVKDPHPDGLLPENVGLLPYETVEIYDRLKQAFRQYRDLKSHHQPTAIVEPNIVFYAGWLGHYVADGSQPLHTTVSYDGWVGPNPHGYTTQKGLHWKFESQFVANNMKPAQIAKLVEKPRRLGDPLEDYMNNLRSSFRLVEKVYQLDKRKGFDGAGTEESRAFVVQRLAAGSQMLLDLWYTAWVDSAAPPLPARGAPASGEKTP